MKNFWQHNSIRSWVVCTFLILCLSGTVSRGDAQVPADSPHQGETEHSFFIDSIAAVVNGEIITISELYRNIRWKKLAQLSHYSGSDERQAIINSLKEFIDQVLLIQEIHQTQFFAVPKVVIDRIYNDYAEQFGSQRDLEQQLEQIGFSKDEFYLYLWHDAMITKYAQQKFGTRIQIKESEVTEYLQRHYQEYDLTGEELEQIGPDWNNPVRVRAERDIFQMRLKTMIREKMMFIRATADIHVFFPEATALPKNVPETTGPDQQEKSEGPETLPVGKEPNKRGG